MPCLMPYVSLQMANSSRSSHANPGYSQLRINCFELLASACAQASPDRPHFLLSGRACRPKAVFGIWNTMAGLLGPGSGRRQTLARAADAATCARGPRARHLLNMHHEPPGSWQPSPPQLPEQLLLPPHARPSGRIPCGIRSDVMCHTCPAPAHSPAAPLNGARHHACHAAGAAGGAAGAGGGRARGPDRGGGIHAHSLVCGVGSRCAPGREVASDRLQAGGRCDSLHAAADALRGVQPQRPGRCS